MLGSTCYVNARLRLTWCFRRRPLLGQSVWPVRYGILGHLVRTRSASIGYGVLVWFCCLLYLTSLDLDGSKGNASPSVTVRANSVFGCCTSAQRQLHNCGYSCCSRLSYLAMKYVLSHACSFRSLSVFFPFFLSFFVCSSYESSSELLWSTGSSNLRFMLHATFLYTCHLSHTTHCHWLCRHAPLHSENKRSKLEMKREGNSQANIMATRHTLPFHIELQQSSTPSSSDEKVVASAHRLANHMRF